MDFYYPNFNNDMWRILGAVFYGERDYFVCKTERRFDRERIIGFLSLAGIGIYDAAESVNRLKRKRIGCLSGSDLPDGPEKASCRRFPIAWLS